MRSGNAWLCGAVLLALAGCAGEKEGQTSGLPETPSPIGMVRLSEKAQQQLGLECQRPVKRDVKAVLSLTGWLELPLGKRSL